MNSIEIMILILVKMGFDYDAVMDMQYITAYKYILQDVLMNMD